MRSNNPVFSRSEEFNRASSNAYGNQTYAGGGQSYPGYSGVTTGAVTATASHPRKLRGRPPRRDQ